ncbi:hypothetical protein V497_00168 [Pseudogymnoascus sp. VKM F-4516 (FW-969)]|nr:hypothetical protein V497_00168 [Pseudogymnoascus sp. VKM F-4516 (FW-969)]
MPREAERPRNRERDPEREREREHRRRERERERERDPDRERRHRERDADRERRRRERDPERDQEREERRRERARRKSRNPDRDSRESRSREEPPSSQSSSQPLSADSLAKLNQLNKKEKTRKPEKKRPERPRKKRQREAFNEKYEAIGVDKPRRDKKKKRRVVSGALLEEGDGNRLSYIRGGGYDPQVQADAKKRKKRIFIIVGVVILLLAIIIPVAVVLSNKNKGSTAKADTAADEPTDSGNPSNSNLDDVDPDSVPTAAKGTRTDPFSWYDTTDFNVTYTGEKVGGLPVIGLFSEWDDSAKPNDKVPALDEPWGTYDKRPARGVNVGGWLSIEPFITPSLFSSYDPRLGIIDEWTLCAHLGPTPAKSTLEKHYAEFVTEQTFADIADAGLDHVRIPFSYWALQTYSDEPYVNGVAWRYLLRGIEWARKYGLRVNLDLHGLPGSQNGWNHSGRQGDIGWLNGTDGDVNAERSLDIHRSLSQFFSQPRYKNIIAFYGLVNEPKMTALVVTDVYAWTAKAYAIARENGITCPIVFGDGFQGLEKWKGQLQGHEGLVLDVHQYVIFNTGQIVYTKEEKVKYACSGWTGQAEQSMDVSTGFGPTIFAEWSQADTDCATYLNNVGWGNRWEGTYDTGNPLTRVLSATCPTNNGGPTCSCASANADPSQYSDGYKQFLQMFAEAQMDSFEHGWGWFYWTWQTETATQWSYKRGLAAGILPARAYAPDFNCQKTIPSFSDVPENY